MKLLDVSEDRDLDVFFLHLIEEVGKYEADIELQIWVSISKKGRGGKDENLHFFLLNISPFFRIWFLRLNVFLPIFIVFSIYSEYVSSSCAQRIFTYRGPNRSVQDHPKPFLKIHK